MENLSNHSPPSGPEQQNARASLQNRGGPSTTRNISASCFELRGFPQFFVYLVCQCFFGVHSNSRADHLSHFIFLRSSNMFFQTTRHQRCCLFALSFHGVCTCWSCEPLLCGSFGGEAVRSVEVPSLSEVRHTRREGEEFRGHRLQELEECQAFSWLSAQKTQRRWVAWPKGRLKGLSSASGGRGRTSSNGASLWLAS